MFAIYSPTGRRFSGPLEQLQRIEQSAPGSAARQGADNFIAEQSLRYQGTDGQQAVSQAALTQYRQMLQLQGQPAPVQHVYQLMSKPVMTVHADQPLKAIKRLLAEQPFRTLPIVNDKGQLLGSVSRTNYYQLVTGEDFTLAQFDSSIAECFLGPDRYTYAVDPVTDVRRAAQLLSDKHLDALPVVQISGEVIGIISRSDILRHASRQPQLSVHC